MKPSTALIAAPLLACFLYSLTGCRQKDDSVVVDPAPVITAADYLPAEPNSYWIYESYYVDSAGNGTPGNWFGARPEIDSFYQIADTSIGDVRWRRLMKPRDIGDKVYEPFYYRASGNYILALNGDTVFSPTDTNRVYGIWTHGDPNVISNDSAIRVTFYSGDPRIVRAENRDIRTLAAVTDWGFYPAAKEAKPVTHRRQYTRFALGIGIVYETASMYFSDPGYVERRLVRSRVIRMVQ